MRIGTFNLRYGTANDGSDHWEKRKGLVADAIRDIGPDIMGVQECLPFQGDEIKNRFPHFGRVGLGRYHGIALDDRSHENLSGEHCSIFYDTRNVSLQSAGTFWHSGTPDAVGSSTWGNNLPRITTWGVFEFAGGVPFTVFNTHFHWDEPYVSNAARLIVTKLAELATGNRVLLVGDFNADPDSDLHEYLTTAAAGAPLLQDVWRLLAKDEKGAGTAHGFTGVPNNRIDWILAGDGFTPRSIASYSGNQNGSFPSDHFPVFADIE
jgi:endonuclease/exonuclease/phosphatase family metal-dependent hydrolase